MPTIVYEQTFDVDLGGGSAVNAARVTSPVYEGAGALRLNPTADAAYWLIATPGADPNVVVYLIYVRYGVLPPVDTSALISFIAGVAEIGIYFDASEGKFACGQDGALAAAGGPVIAVDTWYRMDAKFDMSANPWTVDGKVDGTALTQRTVGSGANTHADYRIGDTDTSTTWTGYFDSFRTSHTAGDYPITDPPPPVTPTVAWWTA